LQICSIWHSANNTVISQCFDHDRALNCFVLKKFSGDLMLNTEFVHLLKLIISTDNLTCSKLSRLKLSSNYLSWFTLTTCYWVAVWSYSFFVNFHSSCWFVDCCGSCHVQATSLSTYLYDWKHLCVSDCIFLLNFQYHHPLFMLISILIHCIIYRVA